MTIPGVPAANIGPNQAAAYQFLVGQGLSPAQASGVVGNLMTESNVNPNSVNHQSGSIGIAQWLGSRANNLYAFATNHRMPANSLTTQLAFMWHELTGSEVQSLDALKTTNSPASAAISFQNNYERCGTAAQCDSSARVANANAVYSVMTGQNPPVGSTSAALAAAQVASSSNSSTSDCTIGWTWPSAGPLGGGKVCIWKSSWTRALIGGTLVASGAIIGLAGFALLAGKGSILPGVAGESVNMVKGGATRANRGFSNVGAERQRRKPVLDSLSYPERPPNMKNRDLTSGRYTKRS